MLSWKINDKWEVNGAWTGMSGNRMTLPTQVWKRPSLASFFYDEFDGDKMNVVNFGNGSDIPLATERNNYRLPFYNRLDISAVRYTHNGYWTFSIYNAYCNLNAIGVSMEDNKYRKIRMIPIIPSISYTWQF